MTPRLKRCAIYTRKSTEEGLNQAFNSLDAQREACEAYITSQKNEGWRATKTSFDDGGLSGGNLNRPAMQALLNEVDAGRIDVIVVYKVDRLTRSLADFAKLVERFDAKNVSFVSVTQQFNTSTSMGRLTLNVLLSFAQFEREVTAERIRDKIAASKKKGLWMGGYAPLGYDAVDKKLVINGHEAAIVCSIFDAFSNGACVKNIAADLNRGGVRSKPRANGMGGKPFSRGAIYKILSNPIYHGMIRHRSALYDGEHSPIIDTAIWEKATSRLLDGKRRRPGGANSPSPLAGKICAEGQPLTPVHATKKGRRYRYYVSRKLIDAPKGSTDGWRLPAKEVEASVANLIRNWLTNDAEALAMRAATSVNDSAHIHTSLQALIIEANRSPDQTLLWNWLDAITSVDIKELELQVLLDPTKPPLQSFVPADQPIDIALPLRFARRGVGRKMIIGADMSPVNHDDGMIGLLTKMRHWRKDVFKTGAALKDLAIRDGVDQGDASRFFPLAFLAPDITLAILEGRQPVSLNMEQLKRLTELPPSWGEQRERLGFPA